MLIASLLWRYQPTCQECWADLLWERGGHVIFWLTIKINNSDIEMCREGYIP